MGQRAIYFALTTDEEQRLLACSSDDQLDSFLEEIEEKWDRENLCQTDKPSASPFVNFVSFCEKIRVPPIFLTPSF
jgi:hypothetical protein